VTPEYAKTFKLVYLKNGCKKITDGAGRNLLLVPSGNAAKIEPDENTTIIHTPVKRVAMCSTPLAGLLRVLGELDSIVAVSTPKNHWFIEEVTNAMAQGKIHYLGDTMMDYEKLMLLNPDVVFIGSYASGSKLESTGLPTAFYSGYLENHPLAQLEWIKFMAAFYNKEEAAERHIRKTKQKLKAVQAKIVKAETKPKVLWAYINDGRTSAAGGDSYVSKMIDMAGGDYVFKSINVTGNASITLETLYAKGKNADIFIVPSTPLFGTTSIDKIRMQYELISQFKAVKKGNVWCFQPWWWQSLDKTFEVLEDLAAIFHPELFPKHQIKHFVLLPDK
jgi:iron complex transport system substrate-binding protein